MLEDVKASGGAPDSNFKSGFGWNTEEHFVEAESAVWERYVKYYSSAQKWRKKPLWYHERVVDLSSASMGTGSFAIDPALLDSSSKAPSSDGEEEGETTGDVKKISTNGKRRAASSGPPERASKRRNGSDQFDRMIEILSGLAGSEAETARETDPVEHATKTLLELDTEHLEIDDVSRLIGHFAEHSGAAKAYTTLAASQASKANDIRRQFLLQILASIEV
ncbi:hypothetical protein OC845_003675 [Tilletia horrida]|nr:hypothetical protein OC845_003675 [Tilletia horrida]